MHCHTNKQQDQKHIQVKQKSLQRVQTWNIILMENKISNIPTYKPLTFQVQEHIDLYAIFSHIKQY